MKLLCDFSKQVTENGIAAFMWFYVAQFCSYHCDGRTKIKIKNEFHKLDLMNSFFFSHSPAPTNPNPWLQKKKKKKRARIFQRIHPKVEGSGSPSSTPNDGKGDDNRDGRHIIGILLRKDGGLRTFKALRIWSLPVKGSMWVWKEANLVILLGQMRKLGQMKRVREDLNCLHLVATVDMTFFFTDVPLGMLNLP